MTVRDGIMIYLIIGSLWVLLGLSVYDDWKKVPSLQIAVLGSILAILLWPVGFFRGR